MICRREAQTACQIQMNPLLLPRHGCSNYWAERYWLRPLFSSAFHNNGSWHLLSFLTTFGSSVRSSHVNGLTVCHSIVNKRFLTPFISVPMSLVYAHGRDDG